MGNEIGTIDLLKVYSDERLVLEAWKLGGHAAAMVETAKAAGKSIMIDGREVFLHALERIEVVFREFL